MGTEQSLERSMRFPYRTLVELFNKSLEGVEQADAVCLEVARTDRHERMTFNQLKTRARLFAAWLIQPAGIAPGDKVAILARNRADWDVVFWGAVLAGAVPVLIDPERGPEGVIGHLSHTGSRALVMAGDYLDHDARRTLRRFAEASDMLVVEMADTPFCDSLAAGPGTGDDHRGQRLADIAGAITPDETAVILCTSGTTGDPREAELTHANLIANIEGTVEKIRITSRDVLGHILPPHHSFGLTVGKLLPLRVGARNVYTNIYRRIPQLIRDKGITVFIAIPALFTVLAKRIEERIAEQKKTNPLVRLLDRFCPRTIGTDIIKRQGWQSVRFFLSGAAPMPRWVLEVFWRRGLRLYEGYGTTENSPVYGFNDSAKTLGSVGKPIPTIAVKIVDEQNRPLPSGQRGEILLGGPCIMKGYYNNPEATSSVIETDPAGVRWLHTGDLGYLDPYGNLFITGRKKFLIVLPGGKNVNPELVESALCKAPFVSEILVVPGKKKDPAGIITETVRAIVRPDWDEIETRTSHSRNHLTARPDLLRSLLWDSINQTQQADRHLSSFEKLTPSAIEIRIAEFEKTSTGKIKRQSYARV